MILLFVNLLFTAVVHIVDLFPVMTNGDLAIVNTMNGVFAGIHEFVAWTNFFFPVDTLFQVIAIRFGVFAFLTGAVLIRHILAMLHIIGE